VRQPKHKRTAAQRAASIKFAQAGRSAQASSRAAAIAKTGKPPPVSKARHQAALRWAAAGRASQARKRAHLKPLPKKQPTLARGESELHGLPVCAAVAVAEHLYATTGVVASDADILVLAGRCGGGCLGDYLEAAATVGLGGLRVSRFWPCDDDLIIPGLVYGVQMRDGYHAVLAVPDGVVSWGMILPRLGVPTEAWHVEWAT